MDIVEDFKQEGRDLIAKLHFLSPRTLWDDFSQMHWRVQTPMILIFTVVVAFAILAVVSNYVDTEPVLPAAVTDLLGKAKPNSPPIPPPTEITSLRVYPIKSCRGFEINYARLRKQGLTLDRNWMFMTVSDKNFMTIRGDSSMTLIDTALVEDPKTKENMLEISVHGTDARVSIPAFPTKEWLSANTTLQEVEIWEQKTDGYVYGDEINKPFSDYFNKAVALVYKGPTNRLCRVNGAKEMYGQDIATNFPDVMSLQIASEASIRDLNRRLKEKHGAEQESLTIERFRPNIIVKGREDHPWEEDTWKRIRITTTLPAEQAIYKIDLDAVARCARCQVPNVNPDTAEKHDKEPWDEMMK